MNVMEELELDFKPVGEKEFIELYMKAKDVSFDIAVSVGYCYSDCQRAFQFDGRGWDPHDPFGGKAFSRER